MENTHVTIGGHKVSGGKTYSTSEVKTGDVWIDGKPIYRKVVSFTFDSNNTIIQQQLGLSNVTVLKLEGGVSLASSGNLGAIFPLNFYWAADNFVQAYIDGSGKIVVKSTNSATASRTGYAFIYYTKTTD